jgi:hypothetical protein
MWSTPWLGKLRHISKNGRKKEEGRGKREEVRGKREEGRGEKREERREKGEGRREKGEGRRSGKKKGERQALPPVGDLWRTSGYFSAIWASTTATAAMLTISETSSPRCRT